MFLHPSTIFTAAVCGSQALEPSCVVRPKGPGWGAVWWAAGPGGCAHSAGLLAGLGEPGPGEVTAGAEGRWGAGPGTHSAPAAAPWAGGTQGPDRSLSWCEGWCSHFCCLWLFSASVVGQSVAEVSELFILEKLWQSERCFEVFYLLL